MNAELTKTASYSVETARKLFAEADAIACLADRIARRMEIRNELQRAWIKGGRKGCNPAALYSGF